MAPDKVEILRKVFFEIEHPAATIVAAQKQSAKIDEYLGYQCDKVEEHLVHDDPFRGRMWEQQPWIGLPVSILQTPYAELVEVVQHIIPSQHKTWVDLGAGYGRLGIVLSALFPKVHFIGYELLASRALEGNRVFKTFELENAELIHQDLSAEDFSPVSADCYFLYDFGSRLAQEKTLDDLKSISKTRSIKVVARGRGCRNWIHRNHLWLSEVNEPVHTHYYSIYTS